MTLSLRSIVEEVAARYRVDVFPPPSPQYLYSSAGARLACQSILAEIQKAEAACPRPLKLSREEAQAPESALPTGTPSWEREAGRLEGYRSAMNDKTNGELASILRAERERIAALLDSAGFSLYDYRVIAGAYVVAGKDEILAILEPGS